MTPRQLERRHELAERHAQQLAAPDGPSIVLRGPAGIGKTHLAAAIADVLDASGVTVRRAAGGAAQRQLAFGALLHLLPPSDQPIGVEFELVQRLRSALIGPSGTAVLVVDDVGLLDDKSAGLVENVLLQGEVRVLATERAPLAGAPAEHALSPALRSTCDVVDVAPMSDDELGELAVEWLGPGELGSIRHLAALSRGNPLVLRELIDAARSTGALRERGGLWFVDAFHPSGQSLERLVTQHLDRLDAASWELLRAVAVAGTLPRALTARIDVESLESLEHSGLLMGDPTGIGHPLYAEVIGTSLSPEQIRRVCAKLVAAVGPDDAVDAARLGHWLLQAEHAVDDSIARAGVRLALGRWEIELARRLVHAIQEPTVGDRVLAIWAHANGGDIDSALAIADEACALATDDVDRVDAGLARAELWCLQQHRREEAYAELAALRATLTDGELIARVDGATALYSQMTGNRELAVESVEAATAATDLSDDARLAVLLADAFGKVFFGQFAAAAPVIQEGLALAGGVTERHLWVRLKIAEAIRLMMIGEPEGAKREIDEFLVLADISGVRPAHVGWLGLAAQLAQIEGRFDVAERRALEAVRAGDHVDDFGSAGFVRGDLSALMIELGRTHDVDPRSSPIGMARARIRLADDRDADALGAELATMTADAGYVLWAPWIAREAVRRGPAPRCAELLVGWSNEFEGPVYGSFAEHAVGLVDGDGARVRAAARALEDVGYVMPALDAHLAAVTIDAGAGPDVELRRRLLAVDSLMARIVPSPPPRLADRFAALAAQADLPSRRQLEIARLAAAGKSSKEIAADLVVSVRTVDNHLAAVYRSLGLSGRTELRHLPLA